MYFGSPDCWVDFIDSQMPNILELVVETWESMPSPAGNELEDTVSESLCRALRQSRNRCDLPFRIDTQLVELDPAAGQDLGRMDIVFSPPVPREDIYFCLECKRLNVRDHSGGPPRPYFIEYVRFGMFRFIRGQYANSVRFGGMLAFVLNGDVTTAVSGIEDNIRRMHADLAMNASAGFGASTVRPDDSRVRETVHARLAQIHPFVIHHLFMAGDPNAPLRPEPSLPVQKSVKSKSSTRQTRNKK